MNVLVFLAVVFTLAALRLPAPTNDEPTTKHIAFAVILLAAATFWALVIG